MGDDTGTDEPESTESTADDTDLGRRVLPGRVDTERLVIRLWEPDDVDGLIEAVAESQEHLRPWMPWAAADPVDRATRLDWIGAGKQSWESGGDAVFGIFAAGEVVGGTGLHRRGGPDTLEIGYWVHVDHIGRGYATEAAGALTDAAFTVAGIDIVEIHHDRANVGSARVPEKLGFTMVAEHEPTTVPSPGEERIDWCWQMRRADWRPA